MSGDQPSSDRSRRDVLNKTALISAGAGGLLVAASGSASAGCWYEYECMSYWYCYSYGKYRRKCCQSHPTEVSCTGWERIGCC